MKKVKGLTEANIRNIEGLERREDLDFKDDGNRFRGFEYKGLPLTQHRSRDYGTFLCIRVDYLKNTFTYSQWMEQPEYELCDEFNGVAEVDLDKLVENCEKVLKAVRRLNEEVANHVVDTDLIKDHLKVEIHDAETLIEAVKKEFKWWEVDKYELRRVQENLHYLQRDIERAKTLYDELDTVAQDRKIYYEEHLQEYGYVLIRLDGYTVENLKRAIGLD